MKKADIRKLKVYVAEPFGTRVVLARKEKLYQDYYHELTESRSPVNTRKSDGVTHQLSDEDGTAMLILIGWFKPYCISTLAHECSHAAFRICGDHGVVLEPDNNEVHAYLLSGMMDHFMGKGK